MRKIDDVYIEILSKCNFRCKHCYNNSGEKENILSLKNLVELEKDFDLFSVDSITLSGGEPLLHPEIWEIIEFFLKKYHVHLITNGFFIKENIGQFEKLKNISRFTLQISVDGYDQSSFESVRNSNSFNRIMDNIKQLKSIGFENILIKFILTSCL